MAKAKTPKPDALDQLAADPMRVLCLMLWKNRHREPDMYVQITPEDIQGFDDCTRYLKVKEPIAKIFRPQGLPAQEAIPASAGRRAVPARAATPPKPYVIVTLVDEKGDTIRPVENNERDFDTAQDAAAVRRARDQAPELASLLLSQARTGEYSLSTMTDVANALVALARAV